MGLSQNENEVLRVEELSFIFPDASGPAIDRLSFSLNSSDIFFLIGPSGAGKTTLLKLLVGIYSSKDGEIYFQGAPLGKLSQSHKKLVLKRVAMTFQRSGLFDSLTVLENLLFPLRELTLLTAKERLQLAEQILGQVNLTGAESKYPFEISGGMQKRLGIARALVLQPELILYDDPTAGLDPITSHHIVDVILTAKNKKKTATLIATSDLDLAFSVSKKTAAKIGFLYQGKLIQVGTEKEIFDSRNPIIHQFTRGLLQGPLTASELS